MRRPALVAIALLGAGSMLGCRGEAKDPPSAVGSATKIEGSLAGAKIPAKDQLSCPGETRIEGAAPPYGYEQWCEDASGTRQGPAHGWSGEGELVRESEYQDGRRVNVRFRIPKSGELPPKLFVCPAGTQPDYEKDAETGLEQRMCKRGETLHGSVISWQEDGRVTKIVQYNEGKLVSTFERNY